MQSSFKIGKYFLPGLLMVFLVMFIDQYSKWLVIETVLRQHGPASASFADWLTKVDKVQFFVNEREQFKFLNLSPFLNFVMVWNQGISFGMLDNYSPGIALLFICVSTLISIGMLIWLAFSRSRAVALALSLIVGGALGNVVDRVRFNAVADFIDVHLGEHHWPAFNVADSCIVLGAAILMLHSLFTKPASA